MQCKVSCWLNTHSTQTWLNTVYVHMIYMCIYIYTFIYCICTIQSSVFESFILRASAPLGPSAFRWRQRLRQPLRAHREHRGGKCAGDRGGHAGFWENVEVVECVWYSNYDYITLYYIIFYYVISVILYCIISYHIIPYYIIPWNIYIYILYCSVNNTYTSIILKFYLNVLHLTLQKVNMILLLQGWDEFAKKEPFVWLCLQRLLTVIEKLFSIQRVNLIITSWTTRNRNWIVLI